VLAIAAREGYWPNSAARSLTTSRTSTLGVLLPDLYGEFFSEVIRGVDQTARREGYQILVSSSHAETESLVSAARAMRGLVDGLIIMAPQDGLSTEISRVSPGLPVVLLNPRGEAGPRDSISIANFEGSYAVTSHLIRLGHRVIATIKGPTGNVDAEERLRGYRAALRECGIEPGPGWEVPGDFTESSGYWSAREFVRQNPRPTAVVAANDYMAIGLMSALRDAGFRMPDEMSVTGFDDIAIAQYMSPALTTVHVDAYELGEKAVRLWLVSSSSEHRSGPSREVLPARLVIRDSCGHSSPPLGGSGPAAPTEVSNPRSWVPSGAPGQTRGGKTAQAPNEDQGAS
jgi:LacI family transcriptional regulator